MVFNVYIYMSVTPSIAFWHLPPNSARFSYGSKVQ